MTLAKDLTDQEFLYGHKACSGCSIGIVGRLTLKVYGKRTQVVTPANCMSTVTMQYPQSNFQVPSLTMAFAGTGAMLSGIGAAYKALGMDDDSYVVGFSGDGGTADIGLQSLSGAVEQGYNFLYICLDNEAYMNTGIQRSGLTPIGASTTTTPAGSQSFGEMKPKKNMFEIMIAHRIPYAATASIAYPNDLVAKLEKSKAIKGPSFIHVMCPCPTGWGFPTDMTVQIGKQAIKSGMWYLAEYENEKVTVNMIAKDPAPAKDYLKMQSRFRHLTDEQIAMIEKHRDKELVYVKSNWCK
jgi:pyruvate ferredoxin oxidoreductase beta subunit